MTFPTLSILRRTISMTPIQFIRDFDPAYATLVEVSPLVRRMVARNSGPFTAWGSGTFVFGRGAVAVIDRGPLDMALVESLLAALDGERITHLVITHTHLDHSPAAAPLRERTGPIAATAAPRAFTPTRAPSLAQL